VRRGFLEGHPGNKISNVEGRMILKWILTKWDGGRWSELICLRTEADVMGCCTREMNFRVPLNANFSTI
jgi:hypothetical protein